MNSGSPTSWLYVHGFLGQNLKHWIFEVIARNLEKQISVWMEGYIEFIDKSDVKIFS